MLYSCFLFTREKSRLLASEIFFSFSVVLFHWGEGCDKRQQWAGLQGPRARQRGGRLVGEESKVKRKLVLWKDKRYGLRNQMAL